MCKDTTSRSSRWEHDERVGGSQHSTAHERGILAIRITGTTNVYDKDKREYISCGISDAVESGIKNTAIGKGIQTQRNTTQHNAIQRNTTQCNIFYNRCGDVKKQRK